ncbi:MAG: ATP-binding protein, partial [Bryobacteraceae bacterium]
GGRIQKLLDSADLGVYTPGSTAGLPLSVLKSFEALGSRMADDPEFLRDRISGTATALLSLVGINGDPMSSREHILLSTIIQNAWEQGASLDLPALIHQIQSPPVARVGVMELDSFFPSADRFKLAMSLNNLLASPGFESWLEGDPLDMERLLHTPEGKPRVSILSIAHLSDTERMFFVSLLLNEFLAWTRQQSGTTSLRAILYMDEIFGYFPPVANPPSKRPLLTLLKQARAFGVGVVLATQNPVDLDYKGLANAGTWFIGRLQTERDKDRLLDGLEGTSAEGGVRFDRQRLTSMLSGLGKRVFLMNNVHDDGPVVFESRWALSYLRGPLTREQIKRLMEPKKAHTVSPDPQPAAPASLPGRAIGRRVALPPEIPQAFIPARTATDGVVYQPFLLGAAQIRFTDSKSKLDHLRESVFLTPVKDDGLPVQWEECFEARIDPSDLKSDGVEDSEYAPIAAAAGKAKSYPAWKRDLTIWIYTHQQMEIFRSPGLKLYSHANESEGDFRVRLQQVYREERDRSLEKLRQKYGSKIATLDERRRRAEHTVEREKEQSEQQRLSSMVSAGTGLLGALFGRRVLSRSTISSAGAAARAMSRARKESQDIERAKETLEAVRGQITELESQIETETDALHRRMDPSSERLERIPVKPKKSNISVRLFTLAWAPYSRGEAGALTPAWEA